MKTPRFLISSAIVSIVSLFSVHLAYGQHWLSIDPLAERHPEISPYAFSGNNPVNHIDPDGRDWYESANGAVTWRDQYRDEITINDERYRNIGASYSSPIMGGGYVNYHQNQVVSMGDAIDAQRAVLNNHALLGHYLGAGSPLPQGAQSQLITSVIHQGQSDFINHPVTQAALNTTLFITTGGIEGFVSLGGGVARLVGGGGRQAVYRVYGGGSQAMAGTGVPLIRGL